MDRNGFRNDISEFKGSSKAKFEYMEKRLDKHSDYFGNIYPRLRELERRQSISISIPGWIRWMFKWFK